MFKKLLVVIVILISFIEIELIAQDTISVTLSSNQLKDAYINNVIPEPDGQCSSLIASVWTYYGEHGVGRSLFGFDFTDFSEGLYVIDARLNLYHNPNSGHIGHSTLGGENSGVICRITENWDEDSVSWENQPATTNTNSIIVPSPVSDTSDFLDIDITPIIKDMIRHPQTSDGFMVKLFSEDSLYRSLVFASSDHPNSSLHPTVVITYITDLPVHSSIVIQPEDEQGNDANVFSNPGFVGKNDDQSLVSLAWNYDEEGWVLGRSFINFDLSEIDPDFTITHAELSLYHDPYSSIYGHVNNGNSNEIVISRITSNWQEDQISWENQPSITDQNSVIVSSSYISDQDYLDIDVTPLVIDMIANKETSYGFGIKLIDEADKSYNRNVVFASSNHVNKNLHPKLVVYTQDHTFVSDNNKMLPKVYPNPAIDYLVIDLLNSDALTDIKIVNICGSIVYNHTFNDRKCKIDIGGLPSGVYFVICDGYGINSTSKFVKY